jgi:hypothetical protein
MYKKKLLYKTITRLFYIEVFCVHITRLFYIEVFCVHITRLFYIEVFCVHITTLLYKTIGLYVQKNFYIKQSGYMYKKTSM